MKSRRQRRIRRVVWILLVCGFSVVTGCAAMFRGPILPPEPLPSQRLLDMLCHIAGIGAGDSGCFVSDRLRRSWKFRFYVRAFGCSRRDLRKKGDLVCAEQLSRRLVDSRHVRGAVVLAIDGVVGADGKLDLT